MKTIQANPKGQGSRTLVSPSLPLLAFRFNFLPPSVPVLPCGVHDIRSLQEETCQEKAPL